MIIIINKSFFQINFDFMLSYEYSIFINSIYHTNFKIIINCILKSCFKFISFIFIKFIFRNNQPLHILGNNNCINFIIYCFFYYNLLKHLIKHSKWFKLNIKCFIIDLLNTIFSLSKAKILNRFLKCDL